MKVPAIFRLPRELVRQLELASTHTGLTKTRLVENSLREYFAVKRPKPALPNFYDREQN